MKPFNLVLVLETVCFAACLAAISSQECRAGSPRDVRRGRQPASQQQQQSPGGTSGSFSQSSSSDPSDKDYSLWPNGGGKVHREAAVARSATIDKNSKVGPGVQIANDVIIESSILLGESKSRPMKVGAGTRVQGSTLGGAIVLEKRTSIERSMLQGPITVLEGKSIESCTLSAMNPATVRENCKGQMLMLPAD